MDIWYLRHSIGNQNLCRMVEVALIEDKIRDQNMMVGHVYCLYLRSVRAVVRVSDMVTVDGSAKGSNRLNLP